MKHRYRLAAAGILLMIPFASTGCGTDDAASAQNGDAAADRTTALTEAGRDATVPDAKADSPADTALDAIADRAPDAAVDATQDATPDARDDAATDAAADVDAGPLGCPVTFTYHPPGDAENVRLAGEWQSFDPGTALAMTGPDSMGVYTATVPLTPGLDGYTFLYDQTATPNTSALDPNQGRRKYVDGIERSAIKVADCSRPSLVVASSNATGASDGEYNAALTFQDAIDASGADPAGFAATLVRDGIPTSLGAGQLTVSAAGNVTIALTGLPDGKYRVVVTGKTKSGKVCDPVRLVFWIEPEAFSWQDALIYMAVTDRYRDGDPANDAPNGTVDARVDFQGGDFAGIRQSIQDGTFDALGVRALWISPFNANAQGPELTDDGVHMSTAFRGDWPSKARDIDPHWGDATALHALVTAAHDHRIRVMEDWDAHHVHQDHEYVSAHPSWFKTGCVCGTVDCDLAAHALDCVDASYLPNVDHTNADADAAFVADAVWWADTFDLDGVRIGAVSQMPEVATRNLAAELRDTFQPAGTRFYVLGQTPSGWSDCADPCNDLNYGAISARVGAFDLDGQQDSVLYYAAAVPTFAFGDQGLIHADDWFTHGQAKWPVGAIMSPYLGAPNTARFATLADYRGQDAAHDRSIPSNAWTNIAVAPSDPEPHRRARIALSWLLGLPGAPILYYGDEYGEWGGAPPNDTHMWRQSTGLTADETATLSYSRKLALARKNAVPMRRGSYVPLMNTSDDTLVFGRLVSTGNASIVALTRLGTPSVVAFDATTLGFTSGTTLHDAMGGPDVVVGAGGQTTVTVPPSGALVLSP